MAQAAARKAKMTQEARPGKAAAKRAAPARKRPISADEAKHRLFSEKVRQLRSDAEELLASADRLLARLS